jgi:lactoylglutathione lyase
MEFNSLIPELIVSDIEQSVHFYKDLLGFNVEYERSEEKFAFLSVGSAQLMLLQDNDSQHSRTGDLDAPRGRGINFSIRVNNLDDMFISLEAAGHPLRIPIREQWHRQGDVLHGEKQLWVMDPDGYLLRFVEGLGTKKAPDN